MKKYSDQLDHQLEFDREIFFKLGSPLNLLSRLQGGGEFDKKEHYAKSQNSFADLSLNSLISVVREFDPTKIFQLDCDGISSEEIEKMELFYKKIADERLAIAQATGSVSNLAALQYRPSMSMVATRTNIEVQSDGRYGKYHKANKEALTLKSCLEILEEEGLENDNKILLGLRSHPVPTQGINNHIHFMGAYREYGDAPMPEAIKKRIARVDAVTALAAKKTFQTDDPEKALDYALVFGILRGHNLRSETGACWAQELSMRWVFAQKEWPQFRKSEGVYLDIAACCEPPQATENHLRTLVRREKNDYLLSKSDALGCSDGFFERPLAATEEEFERYKKTVEIFQDKLPEKSGLKNAKATAIESQVVGAQSFL